MDNVYIKVENLNKWVSKYFEDKDIISIDDLLGKFEDLIDELEEVKTDYEDFKQNVEDNYKPIPISEQLDISDRDFL